MAGFLIPPWYKPENPKAVEMNIVSIIFGFSMGASMFTASMAIKQTASAYQRKRLFSAYIIMCWLDWIGCNCMGIITYCWLRGFTPPSFWVFFFIIVTWSMQIQFTLQIIINRISLLLGNKTNINRVKWGVALIATLINISGFSIWIPARLQISHLYEEINIVWDRTEKAIFLIVDLSLNLYFIHLVRSRLIACGLTKYTELFHFNVIMVFISVSLDCILMGATFLPSPVVYVQFHQLVYLLKLYIEMNVADLLGHIVKSSREKDARPTDGGRYAQRVREDLGGGRMTTLITASRTGHVRLDDLSRDGSYRERSEWENGIVKKVETRIVFTPTPEGPERTSSSDQELFPH
ncbi:glutathione s-transferase [Fusarium beomiforme]|uniref:Glutathione s-transferase n=1 Tax=Fusarium beomiforme TaxID=44412 RepID=A0A9P5AA07_9HYPO|nr:glutathione s-transferase [Fusarium beomiforme]